MIQHISKLIEKQDKKKWLLAGKGPSIKFWQSSFLDKYNVISINHAISVTHSSMIHLADYENFTDIDIPETTNIIMPFEPNWRYEETSGILTKFLNHDFRLRKFNSDNRLYTYDKKNCVASFSETEPRVLAKYASGVALVDMLSNYGIKEIYTIGIDGGQAYHSKFGDSTQPPGLFDAQLQTMYDIVKQKNIVIRDIREEFKLL